MTKTPTLWVSADMLVSQSRTPSPGPNAGYEKRGAIAPGPALTLDKPGSLGLWGGQDPTCHRCPKTRSTCAPFAFPMGGLRPGSFRGVREISWPPRPPPPITPIGGGKRGEIAPAPRPHSGPASDWGGVRTRPESRAPPCGGTRATGSSFPDLLVGP